MTVLLSNPSVTDTAYDATVTAATLGGVDTNSRLPFLYGAIKPGGSKQCKLQFRNVAPDEEGQATLTVAGTCSLGDFWTEQPVSVP